MKTILRNNKPSMLGASTNRVDFLIGARDKATQVINKVSDNVKGLGTSVKKNGQLLSDFASRNQAAFAGLAAASGLAFAGITSGINGLVQDASDLVEINQKFGVVYSEMSDQAQKTADGLADGYGLASSKAKGYLADIGDLVSGLGFSQDAALGFGETVVSLGTDLASFSNVAGGSEEAIDRLKKGLLGEHENLKALGVQIDENMIKERLLANGKENLTGLAMKQAKVEARLQMVMEQSKNAIGDFARSQDSLANQQRMLQASTQDLRDQLGTSFYPIVLQITQALIPLVQKAGEWISNNQELAKYLGIAAVVLTGFGAIVGTVGLALPALITGFTTLGLVAGAIFSPITILAGLLAFVAFQIVKDWDNIKEYWTGVRDSIVETFSQNKDKIIDLGIILGRVFLGVLTGGMSEIVIMFVKNWDNIKSYISKTGETIKVESTALWETISSTLGGIWDNILFKASEIWDNIRGKIQTTVQMIQGFFNGGGKQMINAGFSSMMGGIEGIAKKILNGAIGVIEGFVNRAIQGINSMISMANEVPGVSIGTISPVSFGRLTHGGIAGQGTYGGRTGIIDGVVTGPGGKDKVPAMLTAGEVVLNKAQQSTLARQLGNGGGSGLTINVQGNSFYGDDREFAQKISESILEEFKLHSSFTSI